MHAVITPHTLKEIKDNYSDALSWLKSIGFSIERGRLNEYKRLVEDVADSFEKKGWGNLEDKEYRDKLTTVLLEIRELTSIYKGLSKSTSSPLIDEEVKHYIKGPFSPTEERSSNSSNRARNIGFELYLNALFSKANFHPKYDSKADLSFDANDVNFFVEAKRPLVKEKIGKRIKEANKQLNRRFINSKRKQKKGLIALDLTKIINPENKIMSVESEDQLWQLMYNEDKIQIDNLKKYWHDKRHRNTIGAILHYRLLTNFIGRGDLVTLKWIGFVMFKEDNILNLINKRLTSVVREIC